MKRETLLLQHQHQQQRPITLHKSWLPIRDSGASYIALFTSSLNIHHKGVQVNSLGGLQENGETLLEVWWQPLADVAISNHHCQTRHYQIVNVNHLATTFEPTLIINVFLSVPILLHNLNIEGELISAFQIVCCSNTAAALDIVFGGAPLFCWMVKPLMRGPGPGDDDDDDYDGDGNSYDVGEKSWKGQPVEWIEPTLMRFDPTLPLPFQSIEWLFWP